MCGEVDDKVINGHHLFGGKISESGSEMYVGLRIRSDLLFGSLSFVSLVFRLRVIVLHHGHYA